MITPFVNTVCTNKSQQPQWSNWTKMPFFTMTHKFHNNLWSTRNRHTKRQQCHNYSNILFIHPSIHPHWGQLLITRIFPFSLPCSLCVRYTNPNAFQMKRKAGRTERKAKIWRCEWVIVLHCNQLFRKQASLCIIQSIPNCFNVNTFQ